MTRARHLLQSSVIVIALLALGKITGLIRIRLTAQAFGTGPAADAFLAANQLPEVFVTFISSAALAAAFIPVYAKYLQEDETSDSQGMPKHLRLANTILTLVMLILTGISIIGGILAPVFAPLMVPGFSAENQRLTADLMRIILLQSTLFGISGVLSSILNAHQHFALPALAPIGLDIGYVIGIYFFVPTMGIYGLAWGTVIGGLLHVLIKVPGLIKYRYRFRPVLDLKMDGVREVLILMGPRMVTLAALQVMDIFIANRASGLASGTTSGYFQAQQLQQLPETLLGTAIAIVIFPTMAELFNSGDIEGLKKMAVSALRIIWTLTIPAAVGLIMFGRTAIAFFLEGEAFTETSTRLVYTAIIFLSVRVVSEATQEIVARLFYARHNTKTPAFIAVGWLALNIVLAFWLSGIMDIGGLALASTIAFTAQSAVLYFLNYRELNGLGGRELGLTAVRSLLAAGAMALVILGIGRVFTTPLLFLTIGAATGGAVYFLAAYFLGGREIPELLNLIRARQNA
ncbi:MAG: murein biosynthesis integral membrane protein MurJ [Candidatus Promineifilaceae bacterium]